MNNIKLECTISEIIPSLAPSIPYYLTAYLKEGFHVPARPYVPENHVPGNGHYLRDAQGRSSTKGGGGQSDLHKFSLIKMWYQI